MFGEGYFVQAKSKRISSILLTLGVTVFLLTYNWINEAIESAHTMPKVEKIDLQGWGRQRSLDEEQWLVLEQQTGLGVVALQELVAQGEWQQILELQEQYFAPVYLKSLKTTPLTVTEYLVDEKGNYTTGARLMDVKDGDILITKNSRFLGWRNGHAGLVVDAEKGLVLEAVMLGVNTRLCSLRKWEEYPAFMVLRLKKEFSDGISEEVAGFAKENLVDIPYHLLAGVQERFRAVDVRRVVASEEKGIMEELGGLEETKTDIPALEGTQCAHLIWYAYKQAGIDLDSDGGLVVTPEDIRNSSYLEVVQSYGY